jgi:DNA polymerase III epsilon subunit-like protein
MNWSKVTPEIIKQSSKGKTSSEIADALKKKFPKMSFPKSLERQIRAVVVKNKPLIKSVISKKEVSKCKILLFDIETYPFLAYSFNKWQTNISDGFIVHDWGMLCWSAKWLFSDEVMSDKMTQKELIARDDKRISKSLWNLIDEAEIIIAHNGVKFDIKKMNTRFLQYEFGRPSPYQVIDTLQVVRRKFAITSNRLDYIAKDFFGIEGKLQTETGLWRKCMDNDFKALKFMSEYCDQDVRVLEDVYLKIRAWVSPHPNLALLSVSNNDGCPVCLSGEKEFTNTSYNTYVNTYDAFRCLECGHIYRSRRTNTPLKKNVTLKVSTPK